MINTGPLLAIAAACEDFTLLDRLYRKVHVPHEVAEEIRAKGESGFAARPFTEATWLEKAAPLAAISPFLRGSLDLGEAAVVQYALDRRIRTVCIDETVGRRVARLSGLSVTGSLGILLRAQREGHSIVLRQAIERMQVRGIHLSARLVAAVLARAGEAG